MFSNIVATGEFAISPGCNVNLTPQEEQVDVEGSGDSTEGIPFEESLDDMFENRRTKPSLASNRRRNVEVGGCDKSSIRFKKGKRQSGGAAMLARQIDRLVSAVASRSSMVTSRVTAPEVPSVREIMADLKAIPGLDINSDIFMFATGFLEDKVKREVYVELESPEHKLRWLTYYFMNKGANKNL